MPDTYQILSKNLLNEICKCLLYVGCDFYDLFTIIDNCVIASQEAGQVLLFFFSGERLNGRGRSPA